MNTIKNANGNTYYIVASFESGFDNVYLLSYYGKKEESDIPVQFIVARGWNKKSASWDNGSYFNVWNNNHTEALESAKECFKDHVDRIFYNVY